MNKTFVGVLAVAGLMLTGCGSSEPEKMTPTVKVSGLANKITEGGKACKFHEGTVRVGTEVIMRGADNQILGKSSLTPINVGEDSSKLCVLGADFSSIPPGEAAYQVQVSGFDQVIFTEDELRDGANISYKDDLSAALDKLAGK